FDSVKIENGTIANFGQAVSIGGNAQKNTIEDLTVFGTQSYGIDLNDSDAGKIKNVFLNGNVGGGIRVGIGATDNKIEKTTAVGNAQFGFELAGDGNTIKKSTAS